jgi:hypothetical protein
MFQLSFVLQVDTKCITDEIYFSFVTPVLNDWVKDCIDIFEFLKYELTVYLCS